VLDSCIDGNNCDVIVLFVCFWLRWCMLDFTFWDKEFLYINVTITINYCIDNKTTVLLNEL